MTPGPATPGAYAVGVDVGGTFTDVVVLGPDGAALAYGKARYLNGAFLALSDPSALTHLPAFPG